MQSKTINEWLQWYQEHGGGEDLQLAPDEIINFHEEHGFVTYLIYDDVLEIHHMAGDGKYWFKFLKNTVMRIYGLKKIRAFTRRNPRAWIRKYGNGRVIGYEMEGDINDIQV